MPHSPPLLVVADSNVPLDLAQGRHDYLLDVCLVPGVINSTVLQMVEGLKL